MRCARIAGLCLLIFAAARPGFAQNGKSKKPGKETLKAAPAGEFDELLSGANVGTRFRLVKASDPTQGLDASLYWRTLLGVVAAETAPPRFVIAGDEVIAPKTQPDSSDEVAATAPEIFPTEGRLALIDGKHALTPGDIAIEFKAGVPTARHPAIRISTVGTTQEVQILCAPVRFEASDRNGTSVPSEVRVFWKETSLLRKTVPFQPLTLWLPVGLEYSSSFGAFALSASGEIEARTLAKDVTSVAGGFRKTVPATAVTARVNGSLTYRMAISLKDAPASKFPAFHVFVTPRAAPGEPAWLAVSGREVAGALGQPLDPRQFSRALALRFQSPLDTEKLSLETGTGPEAQTAELAARELKCDTKELVWLRVPLPPHVSGPVRLVLSHKFASSFHTSVLVAEPGQGLELIPHRWRTDFTASESGIYQVLVPPGFAGGEARIRASLQLQNAPPKQPIELGKLVLPAVAADSPFDSRPFALDFAALPSGSYSIWVEGPEPSKALSGRVPARVFDWLPRSPFFVHSMSGCTASWPTSEAGLAMLDQHDLEMVTATGASSQLDTEMPKIDAGLAARLAAVGYGLPVEAALQPADNDRFLARLLRHRLRLIDLTVVRAEGMYNEGLSYHHSYQPSVDRMVRRMQVFAQQTAEYPSFAGVNYSWFPSMYGYVEGGVPTDAHTADRNRALAQNLKAAGIEGLTREERTWYDAHKFSKDPAEREKALAMLDRATKRWKLSNELGWGRHNPLYNQAVRQIRPDALCTLFENAGHDENKRTRSLFSGNSAACYESYTDFGDWPMSAGFTVDWARGNAPGQPVWLTTCWGTSSEGKMKSLFHAFARGMAGGGVPLEGTNELAELARRATGMKFLGQYGAVSRGTPDRRVAILSRAASLALTGRQMYEYHAAYAHLTRLGYPASLLADEEVLESGVPAHVQVLLLVEEKQPLEPAAEKALAAFQSRGGKVLLVGDGPLELAGAIQVRVPLKNIWELKGFHAHTHQELWKEFEAVRGPLEKAMQATGLETLALAEPARGYALATDMGPVRYVAVIADAADTSSNAFVRSPSMAVSLAGAGWTVRDLVKQQTLPGESANGRTTVMVDLVTEPTTLLTLYAKAPARIEIQAVDGARLGESMTFQAGIFSGEEASSDLGDVPVRYTLWGPDGQPRGTWHRGAGEPFKFPVPRYDRPGQWRIRAQELLTGLTATAEVPVAERTNPEFFAAGAIPDVHVIHEEHLAGFAARSDEKLILVEPGQQALLPIAQKLAEELSAAGIKVRLWQVKPEEFDTIPVRWYPRPEDTARMNDISAGKLIGWREGMKPYIDKLKRQHVPELGGYNEIEPSYLVGQDAIVFSGGRLSESLRAVTPWMETPNVPGKRQGRLVVCFSPFLANRQVTAVVANDTVGMARAAETLGARLISGQRAAVVKDPTRGAKEKLARTSLPAKLEVTPVPKPYGNFSPIERIERLLATRDGRAAVLLRGKQDNVAFVDADGKVTGSVFAPDLNRKYPQIDSQGRLVALERTVLATHPGWGFPTEIAQRMVCVDTTGKRAYELPAFTGNAETPLGFDGCYLVGADARPALLPREGGFLDRLPGEEAWRYHDDLPHAKLRFEILFPRTPIAAALSPDGKYLFVSWDARPPLGAFSNAPTNPTAAESVLIERATGKRIWSLRDADWRKSTYSAHAGFAAVSNDGQFTALADYSGMVYLVDKMGEIVLREQITSPPVGERDRRVGPPDGIGVSISDAGELAAFAFRQELAIVSNGKLMRVPLPGIACVAVDPAGAQVVVAQTSGQVRGLSFDGAMRWTLTAEGISPQVVPVANGETLLATSLGAVSRLDANGKETWRVDVAAAADRGQHAIAPAAESAKLPAPAEYHDPGTLAIAKERLGAEQVSRWKPTGDGRTAWGQTFYLLNGRAELPASPELKEGFVHLVYRRLPENKRLAVNLAGRDGKETFDLDLATPEYRVIDLPLRGPGVHVSLEADGPIEVAEFSLWSIAWPSTNLAYIRPASENLAGGDPLELDTKKKPPASKPAGDELLEDLLDTRSATAPQSAAKLKDCRVWWPNTDPDQVAGPWLRAPLDPTQIVDDRRFGGGKLPPFAGGQNGAARGGFFTIDFGQPVSLSLVAIYERVTKQSAISPEIALFTGKDHDHLTSGTPITGAIRSDQFWRLFPLVSTKGKLQVLGVHVSNGGKAAGLSEVEAYGSGR